MRCFVYFSFLLLPLLGCPLLGCQSPNLMSKENVGIINMISDVVKDQGVLTTFASNLDVNVQNPGVEAYTKIELSTGIRIAGTNGEMDLSTEGTGTILPTGTRKALIDLLAMPGLDPVLRDQILDMLGWNREQDDP